MIFYSVDSSWSLISKNNNFTKFSRQFVIRFDQILRIPKKYPKFSWIRHLFIIILINSWFNLKFGKFDIYFDSNSCVFNDRVNSYHKPPTPSSINNTWKLISTSLKNTILFDKFKLTLYYLQGSSFSTCLPNHNPKHIVCGSQPSSPWNPRWARKGMSSLVERTWLDTLTPTRHKWADPLIPMKVETTTTE